MASSNDDPPAPSRVQTVLTQARRDLWSAEPITGCSFVLLPLRDYWLDPYLAISGILWPSLVTPQSTADVVVAYTFSFCWFSVRVLYSRSPSSSSRSTTTTTDPRSVAKAAIGQSGRPSSSVTSRSIIQPPSDRQSAFLGAVSFTVGSLVDVASAVLNPRKMKKWYDALTQLNGFLSASGVGAELHEALMKPLLQGRLLDNLKILNDIQQEDNADRCDRCIIADVDSNNMKEWLTDGHRLVRFATAAYGTEMIKSAVDEYVDYSDLFATAQAAIACHTGLDTTTGVHPVRLLYPPCTASTNTMDDDGSASHILHHFVAVDHTNQAVILALRGTLSISGALVDVTAMDCDFYTGKAHKGMAEMAENVWNQSGKQIQQLFQEPDLQHYCFIITGHSLGAGTACLLNIKCHVQGLLGKDRTLKCYGFAPPPVFYLPHHKSNNTDKDDTTITKCLIEKAMQNCIAYIHDNDAVPFLSVSSVRRLATLLDAVDNHTEHIWFWKRWLMFQEWRDIPPEIFAEVRAATRGNDVIENADEMSIPAKVVVWCKQNFNETAFEAHACDPKSVAKGTVFICPDMVSDHMPEQYEDALDALVVAAT